MPQYASPVSFFRDFPSQKRHIAPNPLRTPQERSQFETINLSSKIREAIVGHSKGILRDSEGNWTKQGRNLRKKGEGGARNWGEWVSSDLFFGDRENLNRRNRNAWMDHFWRNV